MPERFPDTAGKWLRAARDALAQAGCETPALDARLLLLDGLGIPHSVIIGDPELPLRPDECSRLAQLIDRRIKREPVSRILGEREFWGRKFEIGPAVLDPRPDTENLVDAMLEYGDGVASMRFLELGVGSGCVSISVLVERAKWSGLATDISPDALRVARANAARYGVTNRLELVETNWADGIKGRFDLICSNPPYIINTDMAGLVPEVSNHDPVLALDGGVDGLDAYRAIGLIASRTLAPNGALMVEIGSGQENEVLKVFESAHLHPICSKLDLAGHVRILIVKQDGIT